MAGALIGPAPFEGPTAQQRLDVALAELSMARTMLQQAQACITTLADEVARLIAERRSAAPETPPHAG